MMITMNAPRPALAYGKPANAALLDLQRRIGEAGRASASPAPDLMHWLLDDANLEGAWQRVRANAGSTTPGIDGMTRSEIDGRSERWLANLRKQIGEGTYRPDRPRWIEIQRDNAPASGRTRRLGLLTLRDRVVHAAVKQVLEPLFEPRFSTRSFGFRPGRSVPDAVRAVCRDLGAGGTAAQFKWLVRMDIADCFDTIHHPSLLQAIATQVSDPKMMGLIERLLEGGMPAAAGAGLLRWWPRARRHCGVIQGSSLSPLLCNIALHRLDLEFASQAQARGLDAALYRYADDLLLLARDRRAASQGPRLVEQLLGRQHQRLGRSKSCRARAEDGIEWLGLRIAPSPRFAELTGRREFSYSIPDDRVRRMIERIDELTIPPSTRIDTDAFDPARWIVSINTQLKQWAQAYEGARDAAEVFHLIDEHTLASTQRLLSRITGLKGREFYRAHRMKLPRGFWTWHVGGVRLIQLASRAPRRARSRPIPLPWARRK